MFTAHAQSQAASLSWVEPHGTVYRCVRRCAEWSLYDINVPRELFESIRTRPFSYRSRGTLMSYSDQTVLSTAWLFSIFIRLRDQNLKRQRELNYYLQSKISFSSFATPSLLKRHFLWVRTRVVKYLSGSLKLLVCHFSFRRKTPNNTTVSYLLYISDPLNCINLISFFSVGKKCAFKKWII